MRSRRAASPTTVLSHTRITSGPRSLYLLVLEHFSLAPAAAAVPSAVSVPVLNSPHLAVDVLRGLLLETANG